MTAPRRQRDAVTRRYGRQLTNRELAEAVRDRTPPLRLRATRPTQPASDATTNTIMREPVPTAQSLDKAA
jgi:hypothetical protein